MDIYLAQHNPTIGALRANSAKIVQSIVQAKAEGAEFVVTSECALTGYPPKDLLLLPTFVGEIEREIDQLLPHTKGITLFLGTPRSSPFSYGKPLLNSCVILSDGVFVGAYDKELLPTYDVFDERRYFEPGTGPNVFFVNGKNIAITICEDMWGEEMRTLYQADPVEKLRGEKIDLLINLSASPYHLQKTKTRLRLGEGIAKKLKTPLVLCNQVGGNDGLLFDGSSFLIDAQGKLKALFPSFGEKGGIVSLTKEEITPPKQDAEELFDALVMGLRDFFRKQGMYKAIIGLSGGIDSSLVAAIATKALGREQVIGVLLPSRYSSEGSVVDAQKLGENLGIKTIILPLEGPHQAVLEALDPHFKGHAPNVAEENLQSRLRGLLLMALSNKWDALVLACGNKSELAMGYATLYGDMCGALEVIGDLTKKEIYRMAHFLNQKREIIPQAIIDKDPSAELRPNQKDSDSLPPYDVLDRVIEAYIEQHLSPKVIAEKEKVPLDLVEEIVKKIHRSEFKRQQAPPILRVTSKSFSLGRHFPIVERWIH